MKAESQHLDFLVSQYVDGCLEGGNRKTLEQQLLTDTHARGLYAEHREVQDLLDDWGNRIPMVDWDDFDKKLAVRLEKEAIEMQRQTIFRRRLRPVAAAAALLLAAGVGYGWHAMSHPADRVNANAVAKNDAAVPRIAVSFPELAAPRRASQQSLKVEEGRAVAGGVTGVAVAAPDGAILGDALRQAAGVPQVGSVVTMGTPSTQPREMGDGDGPMPW